MIFFLMTLIAASLITPSCSNNNPATGDSAKAATTENNAQFLVDAASINLEEIQLGQLAQQLGSTADVKALGKMMEDAHAKSLKEVTALAKKKLVTIPDSATAKAQTAYAELSKKSGNDFDKAYCDMMIEGHKNAIKTFEKESADSRDGELKNWATDALPDLLWPNCGKEFWMG
ncbi:MAG: hypothetical protein JWO06_2435 [Bacteroidota bacterium]|nr:hypothetical protein [Bacteroidota bacterium]